MKNNVSPQGTNKVRIALIDTGVDSTHPDFCDTAIVQYSFQGNSLIKDVMPNDNLGHGTACASIIHRLEPKADIISIQCLDQYGVADGDRVISAIEWCIDKRIDIINLSFGAYSDHQKERFSTIGKRAIESNILIFASCHDSGFPSLPASLPEYLSVLGKSVIGKYVYHYQKNIFIAHGGRQRVAWLSPRYIFAEGSSFATARMSAFAARIKRNSGVKSYNELVTNIITLANRNHINTPSISRNRAVENNSTSFKIHNAAIVSFTKEMHHLLYFSDLTGIKINSITDLPFKKNIQKNISELLNLNINTKINSLACFDDNLNDVDTVIISRTSMYENITHQNYLRSILEKAIRKGKNIYSLEYLDVDLYPDIFELAKEKNCRIRHPMLSYDDLCVASRYRNMYGHLGTKTPIVGVFGTGTSQGKFTTQLMLRRKLIFRGYKVNNYGTETHSELFGFEGFYPLEMEQSVKFPQSDMLAYIQGDMRKLEITNQPDIIIVGGQSGTVPHSYALRSFEYTIPTLTFLMATLPHIYVLSINPSDEIDFIMDTINVIEGLGKAKVIAITCSRYVKQINLDSGVTEKVKLSNNEFEQIKKQIYDTFGLSVFDVFCDKDADELCDLVISSFS